THLPPVRCVAQGMGRSVALADVDGDGDLDAFLAGMTVTVDGKEIGTSALFLNDGSGRFEDATRASGLEAALGSRPAKALGCAFADIDNDGDQDLCVAVFIGPDRLFLNDGQGHFEDVSSRFKGGDPAIKSASVGCVFGDVDNDGRLDLFITTDSWVSGGG